MIKVISRRPEIGYDNNESFENYDHYTANGVELAVTECGYEACDPKHYWSGIRGFHMLHVIKSGKGIIQIGKKHYTASAGDIFYLPPDQDVFYRADEQEPWEYRWVGFVGTRGIIALNATELPDKIVVHVHDCEKMWEYMREIYLHASHRNELGEMKALAYTYLFLAEVLEQCSAETSANEAASMYVRQATEYIHEHYAEEISVDSLCQRMNISRSYLYKLFKRHYGESPSGYVTRFRLEKARELLSTQRHVVNEVSEMVGFSDHSYFTKRFRIVYGMTPREYVKRMHKEKQGK